MRNLRIASRSRRLATTQDRACAPPVPRQMTRRDALLTLGAGTLAAVASSCVSRAAPAPRLARNVPCPPLPAGTSVNVTTHHNDNARTGANLSEIMLNVASVRCGFGRLFERKVNGAVYAQPLYLSGVNVPNVGVRNVLYVATMRNKVYALDTDSPDLAVLWGPVSLGPYIHLPDDTLGGGKDIEWEVGILSTPVIDVARSAIYVVAATKEGGAYSHKLYRTRFLGHARGISR
jgi:hypothetical protein